MKIIISSILIAILFLTSCKEEVQNTNTQIETYLLNETALHPEGIVYSPQEKKIFVGSYYKGKIVTVDLAGNLHNFIEDETLVAVVGLAINESENWLIVCNSDSGLSVRSSDTTVGKLAQIIYYDLRSGEKIRTVDLSTVFTGGHFINDVISDNQGNVYATDSFSPIIYKIDVAGNPSILINHATFNVPQGAFGLNGIVFHPDNYLIVAKSFGAKLYKIPLDNPSNFTEITLNESVNSVDGILLTNNNNLALSSNNFTGAAFDETVYLLNTSDNWSSAQISKRFTNLGGEFPTTLTTINNAIYVNYGYFPDMVNPNTAPINVFKIQKVSF